MTQVGDIEKEPQPQPWDTGREAARAAIASQGLNTASVRALTFAEVYRLFGMEVPKDGERPEWFYADCERELLAQELDAADRAVIDQAKDIILADAKAQTQAVIDTLTVESAAQVISEKNP